MHAVPNFVDLCSICSTSKDSRVPQDGRHGTGRPEREKNLGEERAEPPYFICTHQEIKQAKQAPEKKEKKQ